jgi:hypothetical protein
MMFRRGGPLLHNSLGIGIISFCVDLLH